MADYNVLLLQEVIATTGSDLWDFLDVSDVLALSEASKVSDSFVLPVDTLTDYTATTLWNGRVAVKFPHSLTLGMFRRVMHNLHTAKEASVTIDERNGRVLLDIGSAVHEDSDEDSDEDQEHQEIFKHLEHFSCDEYDDFNPRHPQPKDRAHRRGDSYFNSDIDMVVGELGAQQLVPPKNVLDLSSVARSLSDTAGPGSALVAPPAAAGGAKSVKDRILAKKGGAAPAGRPAKPSRAVNALNEDSDEER